jgi:hypothetical protein
MAHFEPGRGGFDGRHTRDAGWEQIASRTPPEFVAYDRIDSRLAEANAERLARVATSRPGRPRFRVRLGRLFLALGRAIADESAHSAPTATPARSTTPCPE